MLKLLFFRSELQQYRENRREGRDLEAAWVLVTAQLRIQRPLMAGREPLSPISPRDTDAGEAGVEEHPLKFAFVSDLRQLLLVCAGRSQRAGGRLAGHLP